LTMDCYINITTGMVGVVKDIVYTKLF
jgi:hypothetical protein